MGNKIKPRDKDGYYIRILIGGECPELGPYLTTGEATQSAKDIFPDHSRYRLLYKDKEGNEKILGDPLVVKS